MRIYRFLLICFLIWICSQVGFSNLGPMFIPCIIVYYLFGHYLPKRLTVLQEKQQGEAEAKVQKDTDATQVQKDIPKETYSPWPPPLFTNPPDLPKVENTNSVLSDIKPIPIKVPQEPKVPKISPQFALYFIPTYEGLLDNSFASENPVDKQYMLRIRTRANATEGELSLSTDHPAQEVRPYDIAQNKDGLLGPFIEAEGFGTRLTVLANGTVCQENDVWAVVEKIKVRFS